MDTKSNSNDRQPTVEARKTKRYAGSKPLYKVLMLLFSLLGTYLIIYSLFFTGALRHVFSGGNGTFISSDEPHLLMHSARSVLRDYAEAAQLGDAEAIIYNDQKLQELEARLDEDVFLFARLNGGPEDKALLNEFYWLPAHAVLYSNGSIASGINHAYTVSGASQPPTAAAKEGSEEPVPIAAIGIQESYAAERDPYYRHLHATGMLCAYLLALGCLLLSISTVYFMVTAGRKPLQETVFFAWWDKIYLDVHFILTAGLCFGGCLLCLALYSRLPRINGSPTPVSLAVETVIAWGMVLLCLGFLTSCSRRIKRKEFWQHTLIVSLFRLMKRGARHVDKQLRRLSYSTLQGIAICSICFGLLMMILFHDVMVKTIFGILIAGAVLWYLITERIIAEGLNGLREGDLSVRIPMPAHCSLLQRTMIEDANHLGEGMQHAVEEQLKAQSMKTELITNVSHDLKTPLTSILAYVELLKQQDLQAPAKEYVEVLSQKAKRLQQLTEDLFEAAKAASGSMPMQLEVLDLCQLLRQGIAELDDRIQASGLDWRLELPQTPLWAVADGRLLWRVVENLCSNIFKYAMPASRVYLTAEEAMGSVRITIKNISREPLNISPEALTERFVRGDSSRTSEGSGLGLSIAKNLTELMGGQFTIVIDGDLFKVIVEIPCTAAPETDA